MDAALPTNSERCSLIMKDIVLFPDGSGGSCDLELSSDPFTARMPFIFDCPGLDVFAENLASIEHSLAGEARLGLKFEEDHLRFSGNSYGHVFVSGLLTDSRSTGQSLQFSFKTDQTALGPFIGALKRILTESHGG
jgi:hypothetical protein